MDHSTPSRHPGEDRPSPNIQIQPRPMLEEEPSFQGLKGEDDGQAQQQELTESQGADFPIYESEAEGSDDEQPPESFSSAASPSDGVESETASDSEPQSSDDEQPPQMSNGVAPRIQKDAEDVESGSEESEEEEEEEEEQLPMFSSAVLPLPVSEAARHEQPPQMSNSVAPSIQNDAEDIESGSGESEEEEEEEEEEQLPMFSSATLPLPVSGAARQAHDANGSDIKEEAEEVEEDDESPPKIFTSALPDHEPAEPSGASTSSGDAPTIFPDESDSDDGEANEHTTGSGSGSRSDPGNARDSKQPMADGAQDDFFANLEASARKVNVFRQRQEQEMELWRANMGQKIGGMGDGMAEGRRSQRKKKKKKKKKEKGIFEVSSSSDDKEEL